LFSRLQFLEQRINYVQIPKTATSSIKHGFFNALYPEEQIPENIHRFFRKRKRKEFVPPPKDFFNFVVIREPVERFISAYVYSMFYKKRLTNHNIKGLPSDPDIHTFIKNFYLYRKIRFIRHHTRTILSVISEDYIKYFRIYPFDNLGELEADLRNWHPDLRFFKLPIKNTTNKNIALQIKKELTQNEKDFIYDFYKKDYELYLKHLRKGIS